MHETGYVSLILSFKFSFERIDCATFVMYMRLIMLQPFNLSLGKIDPTLLSKEHRICNYIYITTNLIIMINSNLIKNCGNASRLLVTFNLSMHQRY